MKQDSDPTDGSCDTPLRYGSGYSGDRGVLFNFLAQRSHKDPQRRGIGSQGTAPDFLENIVVGEHFAGIPGQHTEQFILDGGQVDFLPIQIYTAGA